MAHKGDSGAVARTVPAALRRRLLVVASVVVATVVTACAMVQWRNRDLRLAQQALTRGDPERAYQLVTAFLSEQPANTTAKALLARVFVSMGRPEPALQLFDDVGAATPEELHALGRALLMQSRWSDALPVLTRAVELAPTNADGLYELTSARLQLGLYKDALASATRFAQLPSHEPRGWVLIGSIEGDLSNYRKAADAYLRVLEYAPAAKNLQVRADELFLELGRMLLGAGTPAEAVNHLQRSIDILPSADGFVSLGVAQAELGELEAAVDAWTQAVTISPSNLVAREYLANERLQERDADGALQWLKPLEKSPSLKASTAYAFQRCFILRKEPKLAEQWQEKAAALREREKLAVAIENLLIEAPLSYWARVIRAHEFASAGNWKQAEAVLDTVTSASKDPFVDDLTSAVRNRSALPPLTRLPITQF
ncbi:MAG: hypothetical protein CMJ64_20965 [Planctomycetaceae bacterium]|nr:hypothetical protein [Planctomycetaceae bacterium]